MTCFQEEQQQKNKYRKLQKDPVKAGTLLCYANTFFPFLDIHRMTGHKLTHI